MNKIVTLVFGLLLSMGSLFSQKIDYDNSSKWFFGLNLGTTWQTTDVANRYNVGWGLTLGKSFNYNYGKKIYFDIRGRYLNGNWYGQDYDTTSLANYNPTNQAGYALQTYKDSLGFSVNNFKTNVHRLGLELVLHANGIRERTGFDPYIFGGVGFTWHQTAGDLGSNGLFGDTMFYNYDPALVNKSYVNSLLDKDYETALTGSTAGQYRVNFMPSLGFGIGYQVGKRVSIGLEHKTTFTLIDDFDGYVDGSSKYNDIYHYTSAYIQFRFRHGREEHSENTVNNVDNYNTAGGCVKPTITLINPASNGLMATAINYQLVADVKDVLGRENISVKQNGVSNYTFTYNAQTDRLEAGVVLVPGMNTFEITATNTCGSDVETITVNYEDCKSPIITLVNPTSNGTTVSNALFSFSALVQNATNQQITVSLNNVNVTNFSFNPTSGSLQGNVNLVVGVNTVVITSTNQCGTVSQSFTVNYQTCIVPTIALISPSTSGTTVGNSNFVLSASIQNGANSQVKVTQNGRALSNVNYNAASGAVQTTATLTVGLNTFVITSTNACGTATETISVNYQNCVPPAITPIAPASNGMTVSSANFVLNAAVLNSNNGQGITVTLNNRPITNFNFNNAASNIQASLTLNPGLNTIVVSSTNGCGTDTETITVNYQNCVPPVITTITPASNGMTVSSMNFVLNASVLNTNNGQGITVTHNNRSITNVNFNNSTSNLQANLSLTQGLNTIVITSTNACGTDTETLTINYQPCTVPVITVTSPTSNGALISTASFTFSATVQNVANAQGIGLKLNNTTLTNFNYNAATGLVQTTVTLLPGLNTFIVNATNSCGVDAETVVVNYQPCALPTVNITAPMTNGMTVTNANFNFNAFIQNIPNAQGITFLVNNQNLTNYTFNATTGVFQASLNLIPGINTLVLTATTSCGTETKTVTVNYQNCIAPVISFVSPSTNGTTVNNANFNFSALVQNASSGQQGVSLSLNGRAITNYNVNNATGSLTSSVVLTPGLNTFILTVNTVCGTDTETITINYSNCVAPIVTVLSPAANGTIVSTPSFVITATIQHSTNGQGITFTQNGTNVSNYSFNNSNGSFQSTVNLTQGVNTFMLSSVNACGTDAETITVVYKPCLVPVVTFVTPSITNTAVTTASFTLGAIVLNADNGQGLSLKLNNVPVTNYSFNNATGALQASVTLNPGVNTFILTSTTACGTDTETITVNYNNCITPIITVTNPTVNGSTVTSSAFNIAATIQNASNVGGVTMTLNGRAINNFTFNNTNGLFQSSLNLTSGLNTIVITVTSPCGTDTETITVNYNDCITPIITVTNPTANGSTVTSSVFNIAATIQNASNVGGVTMTLNGRAINNFTFNNTNGLFQSTLNLTSGLNTIVITITSPCGTDTETITVNYNDCIAPVITVTNPTANGSTVTSSAFNIAATIQNASNVGGVTMTLNGRAINNFTFNNTNGLFQSSLNLTSGLNTIVITVTSPCGTDTETITVNYNDCIAPVITVTNPTANGSTVTSSAFNIAATIQNASYVGGVTMTLNGRAINNFTFNNTNGLFQSSLNLTSGLNNIVITVTSPCGTDTETITVTYNNCTPPTIVLSNSVANGATVSSSAFTFNASLANMGNGQGITYTFNGNNTVPANFNSSTGALSSNVNLVSGLNTFIVNATNACGTASQQFTVIYKQCLLPVVNFVNPLSSGTTVTSSNFTLNANVLNVENSSGIVFTQNGVQLSNFTFNATVGLVGKITLSPGLNTFVVTATNPCGSVTQTITVNYVPCSLPVIVLGNPAVSGTTVNYASMNLSANVMNLTSSSSVTVVQNGMTLSGFSYNPTTGFSGKVNLTAGVNTFVITATNECGTVTETVTINYVPCLPPVITFTNPTVNGLTVSNPSFTFAASILNAGIGNPLVVKLNNRTVVNFSFNTATGMFTSAVQLAQGSNTLTLTSTNDCGTTTETITVNYVPASNGEGNNNGGSTEGGSGTVGNGGQIGQAKTTICHTENGVSTTMEIPLTEWPAHQAHGDTVGPCPDNKVKGEEKPELKPSESTPKTPSSGRGGL